MRTWRRFGGCWEVAVAEISDEQLQTLLNAAYLFGLEDGVQLPLTSAAGAAEMARIIREEEPDRLTRRVLWMFDRDSEVSRG
jgi:hypothetical protein